MTDHLDTLRDALTAARPALTGEQQDAADALLAALTPVTPRMGEPKWPGALVMAKCGTSAIFHTLHVRASGRGTLGWTCVNGAVLWEDLVDPRPLILDEYRELRQRREFTR